ncbi:Imm32 family immunity protein [Streptomyces sp. NPDC001770]
MRVLFCPGDSGVDVSGGASELVRLALALAAGEGCVETSASAEPCFGGTQLASVEVVNAGGPGVCLSVGVEHRGLLIKGDRPGLTALAGDVRSMAETDDGGHCHIEYFPGHSYLAAGSLAMVVNSPHGGMPAR